MKWPAPLRGPEGRSSGTPDQEASDSHLSHVSSRPAASRPQALSSVLQSSSLRPHIASAAPSRSPTLAYLARQAADGTRICRAQARRCLSRCHCPAPPSHPSEHWVRPAAHTTTASSSGNLELLLNKGAPAPTTTRNGEPCSRAPDGVSASRHHVTPQQSDLQLLT